jgi:trans-aconitate 2-methyltransferase
MPTEVWNPDQYDRFRRERQQPFFDLLALVRPVPSPRVIDLGCGTGELTGELHRRLGARETIGVDSSAAMLERAAAHTGDGVRFERGDIADFAASDGFDVIFSNAALHWLPDHEALIGRLSRALQPGGQLAVQVPANHDHASHVTAAEVAREMGIEPHTPQVLVPETYASILGRAGSAEQHVRLQVYLHRLDSRDAVVEWVKGTLLTDYARRLSEDDYADFLARYRARLLPKLEDARPYLFTFKRILFWAQRSP